MGYLIAVSGKGGVGKTTVSGLIIRQLIKNGCSPVLAIDADPNSCLDKALGVKAEKSIGRAREEVREEALKGIGTGLSKQELLEMKISESLVEAEGFDLIAMGRPEGAGCYCYANNVLKSVIGQISDQYPYVVLDNEAGLENLSRRIVQNVDMLIFVSDPSNAGLTTLYRLYELAVEMKLKYDRLILVINKVRNGRLPENVLRIQQATGAEAVIMLPDDDEAASFAEQDKTLLSLSEENRIIKEINKLVKDRIKINQR